MTTHPIFDIHTHRRDALSALISAEPGFTPVEGRHYSVGIHPWHAADATPDMLERLDSDAAMPCVAAIGETGLDTRCGVPLQRQTPLFLHHIELSERLEKPLVLHAVGAFPQIIAIRRRTAPRQPWIVHGFRGKPQLAQELLRHGLYLSLGQRFNPSAAAVIPSDRLLVETDESLADIGLTASQLPQLDPTLPYRLLGLQLPAVEM